MSRFDKEENQVDAVDEIDSVITGNSFGFDGELDLSVDFYDNGPASAYLEHISKSRIKEFLKCERSFASKYLAGERESENFYMIRGTDVHDTFEAFHKNLIAFVKANEEAPDNLTDLLPPASDWFQWLEYIGPFFEWELDRLDAARYNTDSEAEALEAWTPHSLEVSLTIDDPPIGELPWLGPYDCLLDARSVPQVHANTGYVVVDYKTGSVADKEAWKKDGIYIDLEFYAWMLESEGFDIAAGIGMYPGESDFVVREMPNPETREDIADVVGYLHETDVTREQFPTRPQPLCGWCHFEDQCSTSWNSHK